MGLSAGYDLASLHHTLMSNMKFEPGEFNLMKELRDKGRKGMYAARDEHYKAAQLRKKWDLPVTLILQFCYLPSSCGLWGMRRSLGKESDVCRVLLSYCFFLSTKAKIDESGLNDSYTKGTSSATRKNMPKVRCQILQVGINSTRTPNLWVWH